MTDREEMTRIAQRWVSLWTVPVDWVLFDSLHADEFRDMSSAGRPDTKEGFAQGLLELTRAFPDLKINVEDLVIDAETHRIAVRWSAVGTNKARYLGVGPTNKPTRITGIEIIEVRNEHIVRRGGEWDITDHIDENEAKTT
jgi:steroid delta-isomerase-like uncharacterized protein